MKPSTTYLLLFSLLLGVLGAPASLSQHQEEQNRHQDDREHFRPVHKTLRHHERALDSHLLQRLPEAVRERLILQWGYDGLTPVESAFGGAGGLDRHVPQSYKRPHLLPEQWSTPLYDLRSRRETVGQLVDRTGRRGLYEHRQPSDPIHTPSQTKQHSQTSSDSVEIAWIANYTSGVRVPSSDYATAIALDGSGNVYVTGWSYGSGTSADYATVKYNASGVEQWVARYDGPANSSDEASAIAVDGAGNVCVTGTTTFADGYRYTTIKYRQITVSVQEPIDGIPDRSRSIRTTRIRSIHQRLSSFRFQVQSSCCSKCTTCSGRKWQRW